MQSTTTYDESTSSITWNISNFNNVSIGSHSSSTITATGLQNTRWKLLLNYKGCEEVAKWSLQRVIGDNEHEPRSISVGFTLTLQDDYFGSLCTHTMDRKLYSARSGVSHGFDIPKSYASGTAYPNLYVTCKIQKCTSRVQLVEEQPTFKLLISNFSQLQLNEKVTIRTLQLTVKEKLEAYLYLDGTSYDDGVVRLEFKKIKDKGCPKSCNPFQMKCHVSLFQDHGNSDHMVEMTHCFDKEDNWNSPPVVNLSELNQQEEVYLPDDVLSLNFDIVITYDEKAANSDSLSYFCQRSRSSYKDDFQETFSEKSSCDITIRNGDHEIAAHKIILSARSPVFKAMFESNMKEAKSNKIDVEDVDFDTMNKLLTFIYCDKFENPTFENVMKLYFAADKYEINSLVQECSAFLKRSMSVENVCEVMSLAYLHEDDDLKKSVKTFILKHPNEVLSTDGWERVMQRSVQSLVQHKS